MRNAREAERVAHDRKKEGDRKEFRGCMPDAAQRPAGPCFHGAYAIPGPRSTREITDHVIL